MDPHGGQAGEDDRKWRRDQIAALRLRGKSTRAIAEEVGVSHYTVAQDLKIIRAQWREDQTGSYEEHVAQETARLDEILDSIWTKAKDGDNNAVLNFLRLSKRRAALLGLDFSDKIAEARVALEMQQVQLVTSALLQALDSANIDVEKKRLVLTTLRELVDGPADPDVIQGELA